MFDWIMMVAVLLGGGLLGLVFFAGLWWTVRRGTVSAQPALWFVTSLLLRVVVTMVGIYYLSAGQWPRLLMCLLGFWLARALVLRLTREARPDRVVRKVHHAP